MPGTRPWTGISGLLAMALLAAAVACAPEPATLERLMPALEAEHSRVKALKAHYPADYERLKTRIADGLERRDEEGVSKAMEATFLEVVQRQIGVADGETIYAIQQLQRNQAARLRSSDPEGCVAELEGRSSPDKQRKILPPDVRRQDDAAMAQFLVQTATRPAVPVQPMPIEEFFSFAATAVRSLPEPDHNLVIAIMKEERDPRDATEARAYCAYQLALIDVFLAMPRKTGGDALRRVAGLY